MTQKTDEIRRLIESLIPEELESLADYLRSKLPKHSLEKKWSISYQLILDAIARAQDITQRGVRGVIAEAAFASEVLPKLRRWNVIEVVGDRPFDFKIQDSSGAPEISIQVKLQRTEDGIPLSRKIFGPDTFVVEVQKTRTGTKRGKKKAKTAPEKTRPYQFGDFDILAVNMQPSTGEWGRFMYTVSSWLMPRAKDRKLIEIMQPVAARKTDLWTNDLEECIRWLLSGAKKCVFDMARAKQQKAMERELARRARMATKLSARKRK